MKKFMFCVCVNLTKVAKNAASGKTTQIQSLLVFKVNLVYAGSFTLRTLQPSSINETPQQPPKQHSASPAPVSECSLGWVVVDQLLAFHALSADHVVVVPFAARACMLGAPQEVKGAAIAGPVGAFGWQLNGVVGLFIRVTVQTDDSGAATWASHGWSVRHALSHVVNATRETLPDTLNNG